MKKKLILVLAVLTAVFWFVPVLRVYGFLAGKTVTFKAEAAYMIILTAASGLIAAWSWMNRVVGKKYVTWATAMLVAAGINVFLFKDMLLLAALCAVAVLAMLICYLGQNNLRIITGVAMAMFLGVAFFLAFVSDKISSGISNEEKQSITSPDGRFTARVVVNDQGAMGGATLVYVKDNSSYKNFGLWEWENKQIKLYHGKWDQHDSITLEWVGETSLAIDGTVYELVEEEEETQ